MAEQTILFRLVGDEKDLKRAAKSVERTFDELGIKAEKAGKQTQTGMGKAAQGANTAARAAQRATRSAQQLGAAGGKVGAGFAKGARQGQTAMDQLSHTIRQFRTLVTGYFAFNYFQNFVKGITDIADGYININSRLRAVTASERELAQARKDTFQIAQDTRTQWEATVQLYSRLERATAKLNLSQETLAQITKTVNQSFVLSGATAEETTAGIIQFTQALSYGRLQGQEFNTVAKSNAVLLKLLADTLGVNVSQMKEMSKQGRITTEVMVEALGKYNDINAKFGQVQITVAGAATQVSNAFQKWLGELSTSSGAINVITTLMTGLADNIGTVMNAIVALGAVGTAYFIGKIGTYISQQALLIADTAKMAVVVKQEALAEIDAAKAVETHSAAMVRSLEAAQQTYAQKVRAAEINVQLAQHEIRLSETLAQETVATQRLAAAQAELSLARKQALGTSNLLISSQAGLKTATAEVGRVTAAAAGKTSLLMAGLSKLAQGGKYLFALMGGWITVGLAFIYFTYKALTAQTELSKQTEKLSELTQQITSDYNAYNKVTQERADALIKENQALIEKTQSELANLEALKETNSTRATGVLGLGEAIIKYGVYALTHRQLKKDLEGAKEAQDALNHSIDIAKTAKAMEEAYADAANYDRRAPKDLSKINEANEKATEILERQIATYKKGNDALVSYLEKKAIENIEIRKGTFGYDEQVAAIRKSFAARHEQAQALDRLSASYRANAEAGKEASKWDKLIVKDLPKVQQLYEQLSEGIAGPYLKAKKDEAKNLAMISTLREAYNKSGKMTADIDKLLTNTSKLVTKATEEQIKALKIQNDLISKGQRDYEARLKVLSQLPENQEAYSQALEEYSQKLGGLVDLEGNYHESVEANREAMDKQFDTFVEGKQKLIDLNKAYQRHMDIVNETRDIYVRGFGSISDAFGDFFSGQIKSWRDLKNSIVGSVKSMIGDIIKQYLRLRFINPIINSLFGAQTGTYLPTYMDSRGGSGTQQGLGILMSMMGGGNSGGGGILSSLFGGGTGSGGFLNSIYGAGVNNFGGSGSLFSGQSWLGFGKDLWNGFSKGFGSWFGAGSTAASLAGTYAGAYGGTTALIGSSTNAGAWLSTLYGAGSTGSGLAGITSAVGTGSSAASGTASAAAGASAGVSWIPIIGWIIAAVIKNMEMYGKGYQANLDVNKNLYKPGTLAGIGAVDPAGFTALTMDKALHKIGMNDFLSSLFSGSSLAVGIWGHAKPHAIAGGVDAQFGPGGVSGQQYTDWKASGGWFTHAKYGTAFTELTDEIKTQLQKIWDTIKDSVKRASSVLGIDAASVLDNFSAGIKSKTTKGKDGKEVTSYVVSMLNQSWEEATQESALSRISSEGIIQVIDKWLSDGAKEASNNLNTQTVSDLSNVTFSYVKAGLKHGGDFDTGGGGGGPAQPSLSPILGEATAIASAWRESSEKLDEGVQFLLAAAMDMKRGTSLIGSDAPGSLTTIAKLTEELAQSNEKLADTYIRLRDEVDVINNVSSITAVHLGGTGEELVRFADGVATALGGVQNLQQVSAQFTQAFYGMSESITTNIANLQQQVSYEMESIGLSGAVSMDEFRKAYEAVAENLSPEELAKWWQAGLALSNLTNSMEQLAQAKQNYQDFIDGLVSQFSGNNIDMSWAIEFSKLPSLFDNLADQANKLARAAGMQGASEKDLAKIHEYVAHKAAEMIAALKQDTLTRVSALYGGTSGATLEELNAQIAALQAGASHAAGGIKQAVQSIDDSAHLLIGDLSPYSDNQKLEIAKQQLIAGQASKEDVLRIAQRLYASTAKYAEVFDWVQAHGPTKVQGGTGGGGAGGQSNSAQLAALIKQRDELVAQQRFQQAQQIAANIAQMASASGDSFKQIEEEIQKTNQNFSLDKLAKDLGVTDIGAYLSKLQEQDLPGALGSTADTIVTALHELGANLIAAILGRAVNPAALAPITTDGTGTVPIPGEGSGTAGTSTPIQVQPVHLDITKPIPADPDMLKLLNSIIASQKALEDKFDEQGKITGKYLPRIAENTERGADESSSVARNTREMVAQAPVGPRSTRSRNLPVGA